MRAVRIVRALMTASLVVAGACEANDPGDREISLSGEAHAQTRPAQGRRTAIPCYEKADEETPLSQDQALFLCRGSRTLGPVDCWNEGDDETPLSDLELIRLCRCARSTLPVQCYRSADSETLLTDAQIIDMCRPIRSERLTPLCLPIREL